MVNPIGGQDPDVHADVHRISRTNPIVGGQSMPAGLQSGVMDPKRGVCSVFRRFGAPDLVERAVLWSATDVLDSNLTRR